MFTAWLKKLHMDMFVARGKTAAVRSRSSQRKPPRARLGIECLERRELLSTTTAPAFLLDYNGNLYHTTATGQQLIDTGVQSFTVANSSAKVYDLHTTGIVDSMNFDGSGKLASNGTGSNLGAQVRAIALDATNHLFALDYRQNQVDEYGLGTSTNWTAITSSGGQISRIATDAAGNLFALDSHAQAVLEHTPGTGNSWSTVTSSNRSIASLVADGTGNLFALDDRSHSVWEHALGTGNTWSVVSDPSTLISSLVGDASGNLFALKAYSSAVLEHTPGAGNSWTTVTSPGPQITTLVTDATGNLFTLNADSQVQEHTLGAGNSWTTVTSLGNKISQLAADVMNNLFVEKSDYQTILEHSLGSGSSWSQLTVTSHIVTGWDLNQPGYSGSVTLNVSSPGAWSADRLPPGVTATTSANGVTLSGTPSQVGHWSGSVSWSPLDIPWARVSSSYQLDVYPAMSLGTLTAPQWTVNQSNYSGQIMIRDGSRTYSNLRVTGLPPGMSTALAGSWISISGVPSQTGTFTLTVSVQDSTGASVTSSASLTINAPPSLGSLSASQWTANQPGYSATVPISNGTAGYRLVSETGLPPGIWGTVLGKAVTLYGMPTQAGTFTAQLTLQDAAGAQTSGKYSLTIAPASSLTLSPGTLAAATAGQGYSTSFGATGGYGAYAFSVAGKLPPGMTLTSAGLLSGTSTVAGTYSFTVTATDTAPQAHGLSGSQAVTLTVGHAAAFVVSINAASSTTAGNGLPVTVTAQDSYGNPCAGDPVTTRTTTGQSLSLTLNANGTATSTLTLTQAGSITLTASDGGASGQTAVRVMPAAVATVTVAAPSMTAGPNTYPVTVAVRDPYGNARPGDLVTLQSSRGGSWTAQADSNGNASFAFAPGTVAGSINLTASDGAVSGGTTVSVTPAAITVVVSVPASTQAGNQFTITITAKDQYGNGYNGPVNLTSSDGQAVSPSSIAMTNGVASSSVALTLAHTVTITATAGTVSGTSNRIAVSAASPAYVTMSAPSSATVGSAFAVTITVTDRFGNPCTGAVTLSVSGQPASYSSVASLNTSGQATINVTPNHSGSLTLTANVGSVSRSTSVSVSPSLYTYTITLGGAHYYAYDEYDGENDESTPCDTHTYVFTCSPANYGAYLNSYENAYTNWLDYTYGQDNWFGNVGVVSNLAPVPAN